MATSIKITSLPDIGIGIAPDTVVPVVNLAGTPTTEQANVQLIGNLILAGAGGSDFAPAHIATTALGVNANISNVHISGGANGYVLKTDGVGNLAWVAQTGGSGNTGNIGFVGNAMYSLTGLVVENADLTHGATAALVIPTNGSGDIQLNDSYGNVSVSTGSGGLENTWAFGQDGNFGLPTGGVLGNLFGYTAIADTINGVAIVSGMGDAIGTTPGEGAFITANGNQWAFDNTANLLIPGDIVGTANANLNVYANAGVHKFTFSDDGTFYAPDNAVLGGTSISVGPGANTLTSALANATLVISSNSIAYIQAAINNVSDIGSADWVAYGHHGDDTGGWVDMGFTSSGFSDPTYTITGQGDGYVFVQSFMDGQAPGGKGGNLVLATGENGTVNDIVFATGGFGAENEFARISDANNSLELTRTGSSITFNDGSIQTTAYTGGGGANTGNVTFNDINIIGNGNLKLQPNASIAGAYVDVYLTSGPDVHIATNSENLILGTDTGPNIKVSLSDVSIKTDSGTYLNAWYNIYGDLNNLSSSNIVINGSVTYDSTGNIYVLGSNFDSSNNFNGDSLFLKYTANGELLWHKTWTNSSNLQCGSVNASMRYQPMVGNATIDTILWASYAQVGTISYVGTMDLDGNLVDLTDVPRAPKQINNYRVTDILSLNDIPPGADASFICGQNYDALDTGFRYPSIGAVGLDNSASPGQWVFSTSDMNPNGGAYFKALDVLSVSGYTIYAVGTYYSNDTNYNKAIVGVLAAGDPGPTPYLYQIGDNYNTNDIWIEDTCTDPGNNIYVAINNNDVGNTNNTFTVVASTDFAGAPGINRWQKKISWPGIVESMGLTYHNGYIYTLAALDGDLALFKMNSTSGVLVWARIISSQGYEGQFNGGSNGYDSSSDIIVDNSGTYLTFNAFTTDINNVPNSFTIQYPVDGSIIGRYGDFTIGPAEGDFTIVDFDYNLTDITMSATLTTPALDVVTAVLTATTATVGGGWTNVHQSLVTNSIWTFDTAGDINLPANAASFTTGRIQSANGYPTLLAYGSSVEHGGPELDWMNSDNPTTGFGNANVLRNTLYLNDSGLYIGINENSVANVASPNWLLQPDGSIRFPNQSTNQRTGTADALMFSKNNTQKVIGTKAGNVDYPTVERLVVAGGDGFNTGEGGDIYLWAGNSGATGGTGGDIKVDAGQATFMSVEAMG